MDNFAITSFSVAGLFGDTTITIPIKDNRLVIVGLNGLGKSTCLNIFYHFISRQWHKLREYDFVSVCITINGNDFTVSHSDLDISVPLSEQLELGSSSGVFPTRIRAILDRIMNTPAVVQMIMNPRVSHSTMSVTLRQYGFPIISPDEMRFIRHLLISDHDRLSLRLQRLTTFLDETLKAQILYLPTYRRIEKDLSTIFPDLENEVRQYKRRPRPESDTSFLELVEFGMEDVDRTIQQRMTQQKDAARAVLNNLAALYLRDVLRKQGDHYEPARIAALSDADVDDILNRVDLTQYDKDTLREVISTIRAGGDLDLPARYVAHFFVQLLQARQKLRESEVPITQFVTVCNRYLEGKQLAYDDNDYTISVVRNDKRIPLAALSSGEKQIVSLFSQIYIGSAASYIIIIDEPELSLSSVWQELLLPDLAASGSVFVYARRDPFAIYLR